MGGCAPTVEALEGALGGVRCAGSHAEAAAAKTTAPRMAEKLEHGAEGVGDDSHSIRLFRENVQCNPSATPAVPQLSGNPGDSGNSKIAKICN